MDQPLWTPSPQRVAATQLAAFTKFVAERYGAKVQGAQDYAALHAWSCSNREQFWQAIWQFCGVVGSTQGDDILLNRDQMPGARWFPGARLNFAENLLRQRDDAVALVFWGEEQLKSQVTWAGLYGEVSRLAQALRAQGVKPGDRVAAYLPNLPGAIIGMLATASIGAVWSSCSPDFGVQGVLDRFGRLDVLVNFAAFVGTSNLQGWVTDFAHQQSEPWRSALELNLTVPFLLTQSCAEALAQSGHGSVINVASIYGVLGPDMSLYEGTPMGNPAAYAASKGGLLQLTRWLSTVMALQVRVNALTPGGIMRGQPASFQERYVKRTPLARMGTEEDMMGAAAYLASDLSAYVTGQNIIVDGGWTAW